MEWFESEDFWRDFYPVMFSTDRFAAAKEEVKRIITLTRLDAGSVLDLCCGPGRHAVEFAQRGFQVTGVDRSQFLLDRARAHAGESNVSVQWVMDDMRHFVRPAAFDLACNLYTSFGYFKDEEDNLRVLRNIRQSLKPGGRLVIEVLGKERLARTWQNAICTQLQDGALLVQRPRLRDNWCRINSEWTLIKNGQVRTFEFEHSIYSGRELRDMLLLCGFQRVELFGDLQGSPYDLEAQRLVAVAQAEPRV